MNLFGDDLGDFIRNAIVLHLEDGISEYAIFVFRLDFSDVEGVTRAISYLVLEDIDRVELVVADIECVPLNVMNELGGVPCG